MTPTEIEAAAAKFISDSSMDWNADTSSFKEGVKVGLAHRPTNLDELNAQLLVNFLRLPDNHKRHLLASMIERVGQDFFCITLSQLANRHSKK